MLAEIQQTLQQASGKSMNPEFETECSRLFFKTLWIPGGLPSTRRLHKTIHNLRKELHVRSFFSSRNMNDIPLARKPNSTIGRFKSKSKIRIIHLPRTNTPSEHRPSFSKVYVLLEQPSTSPCRSAGSYEWEGFQTWWYFYTVGCFNYYKKKTQPQSATQHPQNKDVAATTKDNEVSASFLNILLSCCCVAACASRRGDRFEDESIVIKDFDRR